MQMLYILVIQQIKSTFKMFGKIKLPFTGQAQQQSHHHIQPINKTVQSNNQSSTQSIHKSTNQSNSNNNSITQTNIIKQTQNVKHQQKNPTLSNPSFTKTKVTNQQYKSELQNSHHADNRKTKQIKKTQTSNFHNSNATKKTNQKKSSTPSLQSQMQGSKFRILNQLLYTTSSQQAMLHFQQNPQDYQTYHQGYRYQSQKWQSKPVNVLIKYFRKQFKHYKDKIICDLGCGEGFLFEGLTKEKFDKQDQQGNLNQVKNKHIFKPTNIMSFDLVALKPFIKVADIKNLPLEKESVDVVIFCLSLMGKNYLDFIRQAHRVLKKNSGELIISQVESRSKDWKCFIEMVEMLGFRLINNGVYLGGRSQEGRRIGQNKGKYFRMLHFAKLGDKDQAPTRVRHDGKNYGRDQLKELSQLLLTECIYKKR